MQMATATHMVGSAHSSISSSMSPPSPWHPVVLVPNNHHPQHHQVLYDDLDLATSTFPSPTTPASPPRPRHNQLRPAASRRRAGKPRRPRPSRKLPTTYISADAASFRRMVHQVTGADDDVPLLHLHGGPVVAAEPEVLCRRHAPVPPPSRAGLETTLLLPTLDTSALLMLGAAGAGRGGAAPARPDDVSSCCHGSAAAAVDPGAASLQVKTEEACGISFARR